MEAMGKHHPQGDLELFKDEVNPVLSPALP